VTETVSSRQADLSDIEKCAVLLMSIGQDAAAEVVKSLSQVEINLLAIAMTRISNIRKDVAVSVLEEFIDRLHQSSGLGVGAESYVNGILDKALGPEKAGRLLGRLKLGDYVAGIEAIQWQEPRALAELIRAEHPQFIAMILAYLEPEQAQALLNHLPDAVVEQVIPRLAMLDTIPPAVIRELNDSLVQLLAVGGKRSSVSVGGIDAAAKVLSRMPDVRVRRVMKVLGDVDSEVAQTLTDRMFVFEDLAEMNDRDFQVLLRSVDQALLVVALKGSGALLRDKVLRNMSQRAAEMLREEIEARGPMRIAEVDAAKKDVVAAAIALEREGKVILRPNAGEVVS
jgi:flagellar motor switch protein FliG